MANTAIGVNVSGVSIRRDEHGRYSLNDLHRSAIESGKATESQRPGNFLKAESVSAFIAALETATEIAVFSKSQAIKAPSQSGIYLIRNVESGKCYVGSAVNIRRRWNLHLHQLRGGKHHSIKLQRAWDLYGEGSFLLQVVVICSEKESLVILEQIAIDRMDSYHNGYNSRPDAKSQLGLRHSKETRIRLSDSHKGKTFSHTEETKALIGASNLGKKRTDQQKKAMSEARKGKSHSSASKKAMSDAQIKRWSGDVPAVRKDSISGLTGAKLIGKKYQSRIRIDGVSVHLGLFETAEEANQAYLAARSKKLDSAKNKRLEF